ncbi:hypothetical protein DVB69_13845 [Sporosarcina sp. BI001-red]|uniref:hypothetical protein n=1 Tax=Sporosarcina sp. BI001-red TaxID=2282866 RepID=UPI000E25B7AB|nr:hypothetical protein [Sporosarcina sp. BI001-red]REB06015.1 hypothetical protein DVB69_13845 [Sporosarcina sp. BI001-red]
MDINLTYQGAMSAQNTNKNFNNPTIDPLAGNEVEVTRNGQAFKLSVSAYIIKLKDETADFFARDINVQNANPSDIFSYRPRDQWLVFSQYLNDTNFFDSLSKEEMVNIESTLQQITEGLDSLTQTGINLFGGVKTQLDSYEAQLELASSSVALNYFSDKFLTGDIKEGFDQLTKQCSLFNAVVIV